MTKYVWCCRHYDLSREPVRTNECSYRYGSYRYECLVDGKKCNAKRFKLLLDMPKKRRVK